MGGVVAGLQPAQPGTDKVPAAGYVAEYLSGLAVDCSRLIQSFTEKVKAGARAGTQYKQIEKPDILKQILPPELYQQFHQE